MTLSDPVSDVSFLLGGIGLESARLDMQSENTIELLPRITLPSSLLSAKIDVAPFSLLVGSDDGQDLMSISIKDLELSGNSTFTSLSPLIKIGLDSVGFCLV